LEKWPYFWIRNRYWPATKKSSNKMLIYLEGNVLEVIEKNPLSNSPKHTYFDLAKKMRSTGGMKGAPLTTKMSDADVQWVRTHYVPRAIDNADQKFTTDKILGIMATAEMVEDGSYERLTRTEMVKERARRMDIMRFRKQIPSAADLAAAERVIWKGGIRTDTNFQNY
jgi:hypothetical protein